ncbi:ubiquinone biosynthesis protein COQ9, mitochondrial isoform X2 [Stigmatopora nigra]
MSIVWTHIKMAAILRAVRAARTFREGCSATLPVILKGGFRDAGLRVQDECKSNKKYISSPGHYLVTSSQGNSTINPIADEFATPTLSCQESGSNKNEDAIHKQLKAQVFNAALEFVPHHGWSMEAIAAGAERLGLSSASTGMFHNGAGDLVLYFITQCNSQLAETLTEEQKQGQLGQSAPNDTVKFLRGAVKTRLRMIIPYIDTWPQAISILILPNHIPKSVKLLSTLVDDIWYYAGDRSIDMSWYNKRAVLTGTYNTTELVMLQDSSPDFQDTWNFLDNRIQDIFSIASSAKQIQSTSKAVVQGLVGASVTVKNLTRINKRRR